MTAQEARYNAEKKEIKKEAEHLEHERDKYRSKDPYFEYAEVLLQIAIAMSAIAILAHSRAMVGFALVCCRPGRPDGRQRLSDARTPAFLWTLSLRKDGQGGPTVQRKNPISTIIEPPAPHNQAHQPQELLFDQGPHRGAHDGDLQQHDRQGEVAILPFEDLLLFLDAFGALLYFLLFLVIAGDFDLHIP